MKIYFDYASTTPVRKEVLEEMLPYFDLKFGNPSSLHSFGQEALKAIDEAREKIKNILNAEFLREIIFTSSATESNNLAIKGLVFYHYFFKGFKPHIITSSIEHPSVLEVLADLEEMNLIETTYIKPEKNSLIDKNKIISAIKENTILITIHYVNSELGTIQKIKEIGEEISKLNKKIYFHTDAAQALTEDLNVQNLKVDLMTFSSHKIYGPKGTALLYIKKGIPVVRLISGSEQEYNFRASTEAVPLIVAFSKALEILQNEKEKIYNYLKEIRDYFVFKINENFSDKIFINTDLENSSPKILNLFFKTKKSQELLIYLDTKGIMVSAGTACQARANEPSYVVSDIFNKERAEKSLRFSFSIYNKKEEVDYLIETLKNFI